jgi:threonyl-tRNA synthetase
MIISNAKVEVQYKADVSFSDEHIFLTDAKANAKFKEVFAESLLEAKTHDGHWQYVKAIMKPYIEEVLFESLPNTGYWKAELKQDFKSVLERIKIQCDNASQDLAA